MKRIICVFSVLDVKLDACLHDEHETIFRPVSDASSRRRPRPLALLRPFDVRSLRPAASSFTVAVSERHHEGVRHST